MLERCIGCGRVKDPATIKRKLKRAKLQPMRFAYMPHRGVRICENCIRAAYDLLVGDDKKRRARHG